MVGKVKICDFCKGPYYGKGIKVVIEIGDKKTTYNFCNFFDARQGLNKVFADMINSLKAMGLEIQDAEQRNKDNKNIPK